MTITDERPTTPSVARTVPRRHSRTRRFIRRFPLRAAVALLLIVEIYPLVWLFLSSLKSQNEFLTTPSWSLPHLWVWSNYVDAWTTGHMGIFIRNSIIATFPSLFFIILFGVAAGFALEVMIWRGRNVILLAFLAGIMIPGQMILLPLFTIYYHIGLSGSLLTLIITYTATGLPLTVFMMATYFRSVPREVFEASTLDGAGMLRSFFLIGVPMVRNAIVTVALVQFFFIWNDLLIALTFINDPNRNTVQLGLLNFTGQYGTVQYGPLFAAICINVSGLLILYMFLNQRVMRGLAAGSVKG
jgi:raffinose/stachyose/melibiose transport system permease protein